MNGEAQVRTIWKWLLAGILRVSGQGEIDGFFEAEGEAGIINGASALELGLVAGDQPIVTVRVKIEIGNGEAKFGITGWLLLAMLVLGNEAK
jgi:hypothetical protein